VDAPFDLVYRAALDVVSDMEFQVRTSDKESGHISAEHVNPFGEKSHFLNLVVSAKGEGTEVSFSSQKRKFFIGGGSPESRLKQFRAALEKSLGVPVVVAAKEK
jgi:hypothetical protein